MLEGGSKVEEARLDGAEGFGKEYSWGAVRSEAASERVTVTWAGLDGGTEDVCLELGRKGGPSVPRIRWAFEVAEEGLG